MLESWLLCFVLDKFFLSLDALDDWNEQEEQDEQTLQEEFIKHYSAQAGASHRTSMESANRAPKEHQVTCSQEKVSIGPLSPLRAIASGALVSPRQVASSRPHNLHQLSVSGNFRDMCMRNIREQDKNIPLYKTASPLWDEAENSDDELLHDALQEYGKREHRYRAVLCSGLVFFCCLCVPVCLKNPFLYLSSVYLLHPCLA